MKKNVKKKIRRLLIVEFSIFIILLMILILPNINNLVAVVGEGNVTVQTLLDIGNVYPEILNVTINNQDATIDLSPNTTVIVIVEVIARDYNGEDDIQNITAEFFDNAASAYGNSDDLNNHYTNSTCSIDTSYGDAYEVNATCTFQVEYFANNATWNATALATDNLSWTNMGSDTIVINTLIALGLPNTINYGEVNATAVSDEQIANVTNMGNVVFNLSLSGYGKYVGDGNAMNCTLGVLENISIDYERYNLTATNPGTLLYADFDANYTNLTSSAVVRELNVPQRQNDTAPQIDDTNATYWRIYVPIGVAGTCSGNIVFGATQEQGA